MNRRHGRLGGAAAVAAVAALSATLAAPAGATATGRAAATQHAGVSRVTTSSSSGGQVKLSGWATFSGAVIATGTDSAKDMNAADEALGVNLIGADLVYRPELSDLFIRLDVTSIPTVGTPPAQIVGSPVVLYGLKTTINGVPIDIRMQSTGSPVSTSANGVSTGAQFGLFVCATENTCTLGATLQGGYGTTGEEIVVDVPFSTLASLPKTNGTSLAIHEGSKIGPPHAYSAHATWAYPSDDESLIVDRILMSHKVNVVIPKKSVRVTIGKVTKTAALKNGYFSVSFPKSAFRHATETATTRTCLGATCVVQHFTIHR